MTDTRKKRSRRSQPTKAQKRARRQARDRAKDKREKAGSLYEQAVADVAHLMDPGMTVTQGEWIEGPDGRRDMDVLIVGTADGRPLRILIECKDYDPRKRGPVGIGLIDALESKRRDVGIDTALLCSNAGFTRDAKRKARRVGIGLIGVMREGDARIRVRIDEDIYTRKLAVANLRCAGWFNGQPVKEFLGVQPDSILFEGVPISNWVLQRVQVIIMGNPIVHGPFVVPHRFTAPLHLASPAGTVAVDQLNILFDLSGTWMTQEVQYDASAGVYDWGRCRITLAPGEHRQFEIHGVDFNSGTPIRRPPDDFFDTEHRGSEVSFGFALVSGLAVREPIPDLDSRLVPEDAGFVLSNVPPDAFESSPT